MLNKFAFHSLITVGFSLAWMTCGEARPHGFHLKSGDARAPVQENGAWVIHSGKKALIDWENFSIDQKESVRFQQMDSHSYVLNRVVGGKESVILGELLSNGAIYLINPQGIFIGPNAYIETAGFIASTLDLLKEDLSGKALHFAGDSRKGIVNQGIIHCPAGDIFLIGHHVENSGTLSSPEGRQGLLAGFDVVIQPKGAPQVQIRSDRIITPEELAENPYGLAIRHRGTSVAQEAYFVAEGLSEVSGNITAQNGDKGGHVRLLGEDVHLLNGARIDASGAKGGGEVLIGGDYQGKNPEIKNTKHIWAGQDTEVRADALEKGEGGKVIFWSDEATFHYGKISICGGPEGGDGGLAEVSGKTLDYRGFTEGKAPYGKAGMLLLDPNDIAIGTLATTGSFTGCGSPPSTYVFSGVGTNQILWSNLNTQLAGCNVAISTVGSGGASSGSITVNAGGNVVSWNTPNTLTLTAASFISISSAITNTSAIAGFTAMDFTANGIGATNNAGILLNGASLTTNTGAVTLKGTSSTATTASHGVFNAGTIITTNGAISVTGTVPLGATGSMSGIYMASNDGITSSTGNISLIGTSSASGVNSHGVSGSDIANWTTGTTGTVTFTNCAGGSGSGSCGVILAAFSTGGSIVATNIQAGSGGSNAGFLNTDVFTATGNIQITATNPSITGASQGIETSAPMSSTGGGDITLNGTSGAGTSLSDGINVGGPISTTGAGNISLTGAASGSAGAGSNIGIRMLNRITAATGSITFSGTSTASGAGCHGVRIQTGSTWVPGTTGIITFSNCSGSNNGTASHGVNFATAFTGNGDVTFSNCTGSNNATTGGNGVNIAAVFSTTGAITATNLIVGNGNGGKGFVSNANFSTSGASKAINITASANGTTGAAHGISLTNGTLSTSGGGGITLNGTGGASNAASHGINMSGGLISTTVGNGAISLTGHASGSAASVGILSASTNSITSTSGSITLSGTSTASVAGAHGVSITSPWASATTNTLSITGTGGSVAGSYGISITGALTASGPLILNGTAGGGAGTYANGIGTTIITKGNILSISGTTFLTGTSTLDTTNNGGTPTGANISFSSTIDGTQVLTLNAGTGGTISFSDVIGGTAAPTNLIFTNANLIQIGNNITVSGANPLSFPDPVSLTGTSNITSNNNDITFGSTLNGAQALTLTAGTGTISFNGAVGNTAPLINLMFASANLIQLGSNITITGANPLSFPSPVRLTGPSTITSNSANVTFMSTLNGAQALTVAEGSGTTAFNGNVGGTTPLGAVSISGNNGSFSVGPAVTTIRASSVSIGNTIPTTLNNTALVTIDTSSSNGLISFGSTVNGTTAGTQNLALNAGTGNITLSNSIGNTASLGALSIVNATNVTASGSIEATSLTQAAGSGTTLFSGILTIGSDISLTGNNFTFSVPEVSANNVTVANSGLLSVPVSTFFSLNGAFLQSGTGPVQIQGIIFTANQNITFDSGVTLMGNANFNTGGAPGNIVFASTVDGAHNLTLNAGNVSFGGIVGGTPLNSLNVTAAGTITTAGNQTVAVGPMIYNGNVILTANTQFLDNGTNPMTFQVTSGDSIAGNFNLILRAPSSSISVEGDIVLSGSSGSAGGSCTATSSTGLVFSGQILTQGGNAAPGMGGHGGLVALNATSGSISVHNIDTSGGNGTVAGGSAGNILIQPSGSYSGGFPVGIIVLNNDLSIGQDGNLVALAGSGGGGLTGTITLSANRSSPATVATITSSAVGNDIFISGLNFVMGPNEAMTGLGNITLSCPQMTLGDLVALDSLTILATNVTLLTHGDESILDKFGNLYTSPSLHFFGGSGYVQTGVLNPPGPLDAQDLGLSSATFRPLLILGDPVILNFDTAPRPPPPSPFVVSKHAKEYAIYKLMIADAELSDLLPVGPCPEPYKLRKEQERCPLPMPYEIRKRDKGKVF